jgi:hypothetical protein
MTTVTQQVYADERPASAAGFNLTASDYALGGVLSHPVDLINKLYKIDEFRGYIAANVLTNALGYAVLNGMLWDNRKLTKVRATAAMAEECFGVDGFNEEEADKTLLPDNWLGLENGLSDLPRPKMANFLGVYKQLLREQLSEQHAKDMPPTMPQEVIAQLHGKKPRDNGEQAAFIAKMIEDSGLPLTLMQKQIDTAKTRQAEQNARQYAKERDALIGEFKATLPEAFSNEHWQTLPAYIQYRYVFGVYKQIMASVAKAATEATEGKDDALAKFDNALELAKEVHAELKATEQHPQVQLAFDKGVLDADKYGLE